MLFNRFFPIVDTCFSCEDIARQSCATVRRWQFFWQIFASYIFSKLCVQHISDMHSKFALPHDFVILAWLREATRQISTGFASWLRYCTDVAQRRPTTICTMIGHLNGWYTIGPIYCWGSCPVTEFCQVQYSLCVQVLRSPILTALLHGT